MQSDGENEHEQPVADVIDASSPAVRANLFFRLVLEVALLAGIAVASVGNYDGVTAWIAAVAGIVGTAVIWGVFATPGDPSRSGKTVVDTPGAVRLAIEFSLFGLVTIWLAIADNYLYAGLLAGGAAVHYALWPARIRWMLRH